MPDYFFDADAVSYLTDGSYDAILLASGFCLDSVDYGVSANLTDLIKSYVTEFDLLDRTIVQSDADLGRNYSIFADKSQYLSSFYLTVIERNFIGHFDYYDLRWQFKYCSTPGCPYGPDTDIVYTFEHIRVLSADIDNYSITVNAFFTDQDKNFDNLQLLLTSYSTITHSFVNFGLNSYSFQIFQIFEDIEIICGILNCQINCRDCVAISNLQLVGQPINFGVLLNQFDKDLIFEFSSNEYNIVSSNSMLNYARQEILQPINYLLANYSTIIDQFCNFDYVGVNFDINDTFLARLALLETSNAVIYQYNLETEIGSDFVPRLFTIVTLNSDLLIRLIVVVDSIYYNLSYFQNNLEMNRLLNHSVSAWSLSTNDVLGERVADILFDSFQLTIPSSDFLRNLVTSFDFYDVFYTIQPFSVNYSSKLFADSVSLIIQKLLLDVDINFNNYANLINSFDSQLIVSYNLLVESDQFMTGLVPSVFESEKNLYAFNSVINNFNSHILFSGTIGSDSIVSVDLTGSDTEFLRDYVLVVNSADFIISDGSGVFERSYIFEVDPVDISIASQFVDYIYERTLLADRSSVNLNIIVLIYNYSNIDYLVQSDEIVYLRSNLMPIVLETVT